MLYQDFSAILKSGDSLTIFNEIISRADSLEDNAETLEQLEGFYKEGSHQQKNYQDALEIIEWYNSARMFEDLSRMDSVIEAIQAIVDMEMPFQKMNDLANLVFKANELRDQVLQDKYDATMRRLEQDRKSIDHELQGALDMDLTEDQLSRIEEKADELRTQYESDMRRLTFIAEADLHKGGIPKLDHCPFCNGELPKEKTQSCLDAAIAEADKIELRIKDLQYADEALTNELLRLQSQKEVLLREQQQVQAAIRGELRPQVEALRDKLVVFTAALEKAKAKEMIRYFTEVLNDQLLRINEEDEFSTDFDVRGKIREVLQAPLERLLTEILEKCNYDNYVGSRFDEDMCDVVVNGSEKLSQGQGFRAFLNTVMALAVQEMLNEFDLHMPHLLVMDSPILSLKEREENVGTEVTSDSMRGGLFQYMIDHEENRQTIVLENEIPPLDYSTANIVHFTRTPGIGRYGLIDGYRD